MRGQIKELIENDRQCYVDDPIYRDIAVKMDRASPMAQSIAASFGHKPPQDLHIKTGHNRVRLRWMKPDGRGGLVPR